jgi:hypothetical protein
VDDEVYVEFSRLGPDHGITPTRPGLNNWMDAGIFPPAYQITANRIAWKLSDIKTFKETRPLAGEPVPVLWSPRVRSTKPVEPTKPVGRPRGSRVVTGADGRRRVVLPRGAPAPG